MTSKRSFYASAWASTACALFLLAAGCGARTGIGGSHGTSSRDNGVVPADARIFDGPPRDTLRLDTRIPHDSCLPIPSGQVAGTYSGKWTGTYRCPNQLPQTVSGELKFSLQPATTPESFNVRGDMFGTVVSIGLPFSTPITGTMGCTALDGRLPRIVVGSGAFVFEGTGTLRGTFVSQPRGFPNGQWRAQQSDSACSASGSWSALR